MSVHLVTGYAGTEHITSADDGSFNASFFGAGQFVMEIGNQCKASIIDNNTVRVLDGDILMKGRHIRINQNTYEDCLIETGTAGMSRNDLICMRYSKDATTGIEVAELVVVQGDSFEGTPSDPEYTDGDILAGDNLNYMPLYRVKIVGVVLTEIECLFDTIPTYETLARKYEAEFKRACETHLDSLGILDTMEEIDANTQDNQLAGALALKELNALLTAYIAVIKGLEDSKQDAITGAITTALTNNFTANRALFVDGNGKIQASAITSTELAYLSGLTSNVQTQLNGKANSSHTHSYLPLSGGTVTGTTVFSKTTDLSGTANNSPALIVGGTATTAHMEMDANEIQAKTNGTSNAALYINKDGGDVFIGSNSYSCVEIEGHASCLGDLYIDGVVDVDGSGIYFTMTTYIDSAKAIYISPNGNGVAALGDTGGYACTTGYFRPTADNDSQLGATSQRWKQVCAATSSIVTSDRNMKENIEPLTDIHKQFFLKLIPVSFTFKDGESGRTHIGFISQDVEDAMTELGMSDLDFAGFCKDVKTKVVKVTQPILNRDGVQLLDKEGNPRYEEVCEEVPDLDDNGNEQYIYSLRYEEFIALIAYVVQETVNDLTATKNELSEVQTTLKSVMSAVAELQLKVA